MTASSPKPKIKLAHVINNATGMGGVSNVAYQLLKLLPDDRYDRHLYSLKTDSDDPDILTEGSSRFNALGVKVSFAPRHKKSYAIGDLSKWLLENEIEVLHTHSYKPNMIGRMAGVLCGKMKIVGHYHNYYDNKWDAEDSLIFDQLLGSHSDRLIAVSKAVQHHIVEKTGIPLEKIEVIKNGVDFERFDSSPRKNHFDAVNLKKELDFPENRKVIGVVGRISAQKAQDDFIRAARQIKDAVPNTVFLIVGETGNEALRTRLKKLVAELGLERDVIFTGYLPEIQRIFAILDILVVPSLWEGFGLILLEAMACGKPIVATNIAPILEVVVPGETAWLVPPALPAALASEVIHLLNHPEEAQAMGEKGRERAKAFSWDQSSAQLDRLYRKLLNPTRK